MTPQTVNSLLIIVCLMLATCNYLVVQVASRGDRGVDVFIAIINSFAFVFCLLCAAGCAWFRPKG